MKNNYKHGKYNVKTRSSLVQKLRRQEVEPCFVSIRLCRPVICTKPILIGSILVMTQTIWQPYPVPAFGEVTRTDTGLPVQVNYRPNYLINSGKLNWIN